MSTLLFKLLNKLRVNYKLQDIPVQQTAENCTRRKRVINNTPYLFGDHQTSNECTMNVKSSATSTPKA